MTIPEPGTRIEPRWWGWGDPAVPVELPARAVSLLESRGIDLEAPIEIPDLAFVEIPEPRTLPAQVLEAAGPSLRTDREARVRHSGGHSLADLLARRSGRIPFAPDAVATPVDEAALRRLLDACRREDVAVVPWGGGTSVTGGLSFPGEGFKAFIAIDMARFTDFEVDPVAMTAKMGSGLRGPEAEALLNDRGFTLGHFPQSFEFATIGGFAAARSAGQASSGYGRFDEIVTSIRLVAPAGDISTIDSPRASAGPSVREIILGSEGALGLITEVTARIKRKPETSIYEAWLVRDFDRGREAAMQLSQSGSLPAVLRVSDRSETEISIGMARPDGLKGTLFDRWLAIRGRREGSMVIVGFEGNRRQNRLKRSEVRRALEDAGGVSLGQGAGRSWSEGRFHGPYLREGLLDRGLVVETFETAAVWSKYGDSYRAIRDRTEERLMATGMKGVVMCHLSHCYPESASLYFTVIASPGPAGPNECWRVVKKAALDEIGRAGLTLSHHHGVGRDHSGKLEEEIGQVGIEALSALKRVLDPSGIMNPGCLIRQPDSSRHTPR